MRAIRFTYINYKGATSLRSVQPIRIFWGTSVYHGAHEQWLLEALDLDKQELRTFALGDIVGIDCPSPDPSPCRNPRPRHHFALALVLLAFLACTLAALATFTPVPPVQTPMHVLLQGP